MENFNRKIDIAGLKYGGKYGRGLCTMRNILNTESILKIFKIVSLLIAILFESPNLSGAADFDQPEAQ